MSVFGVGPHVNKFEQVSIDGHQESVPCLVGWGEGFFFWGGVGPMSQCIMGNGHMGTSEYRMTDGQTPVKTLPSRNLVCVR